MTPENKIKDVTVLFNQDVSKWEISITIESDVFKNESDIDNYVDQVMRDELVINVDYINYKQLEDFKPCLDE